LLLHADHEPQTPSEWEQWVKVTRTAIRRQAITIDAGFGTSDETVALRLIHTHCARRIINSRTQGKDASACL
jgi:RNA-directed DNA polymerase